MGWYPEGVREGGLHCNWFITLQNPNIKRKIFICCPCTFLYIFYRSRREKLSKVLTKFILCDHVFLYIFFSQTTVFLYALRQRRIWHWALLQTERLKLCRNCTLTQMNQWRNWCNSSCLKWFLFGSYSQRAKNHLIH